MSHRGTSAGRSSMSPNSKVGTIKEVKDSMKDSVYNLRTYDDKGNVSNMGKTSLDTLKNDVKSSFRDPNSPNKGRISSKSPR